MARSGILYSHVAQAALKVVAGGKNPTVDNVREALGGTGSKSTIAPLLKRWKAEHQDKLVEKESGLPAELLLAVKGVYEKLQEDVGQQLELARAQQRVALDAAAARLGQSETDNRNLSQTRLALAADLAQTKDELAQLRAEQQERAVALAALGSDNAGLRDRLADRGAEIVALNQQLTQTRTQFEHYQESSAALRSAERQTAEQRTVRLEQELDGARQRLAQQQSGIVQQQARIAQLEAEGRQWRADAAAAQQELAALRPQRDQLAYQYQQASASAAALAEKLDAAGQALTESRMALAAGNKQLELLEQGLRQLNEEGKELAQARLALLVEATALREQLRQCEAVSQKGAASNEGTPGKP